MASATAPADAKQEPAKKKEEDTETVWRIARNCPPADTFPFDSEIGLFYEAIATDPDDYTKMVTTNDWLTLKDMDKRIKAQSDLIACDYHRKLARTPEARKFIQAAADRLAGVRGRLYDFLMDCKRKGILSSRTVKRKDE
jgi:hypothetical protein